MNKVYQRIWSKIKERWILVDEKTSHGSGPAAIFGAVTLAAFLSMSGTVSAVDPGALPTGGTITAGQGSISTNNSLITNWNTFNIGTQSGGLVGAPVGSSTGGTSAGGASVGHTISGLVGTSSGSITNFSATGVTTASVGVASVVGRVASGPITSSTLPTGGKIVAGSGNISTKGRQMTVKQDTQKMIANWDTFNIGKRAGVTFRQPNSDAIALNRIYDQNPSQILGSLSANGSIFLINPSGIVFGKSAQINVGGLVASSLDMLDSDFLAGKYTFTNDGNAGSVINQGDISVMPGGIVALIAPKVTNEGTITATSGNVLMAAGDKVSLDFNGDGLISYTVDQGAVDALAENNGLIKADGGVVVMTAEAADILTQAVVNNTGVIRARTLENKGGRIMLLSDMESGTTIVDGKLDASAPKGGDGGFIETSAENVKVEKGADVTTKARQGESGTWLIDPTDYIIGTDITGATLSSNLNNGNILIQTAVAGAGNGDIFVNEDVSWSANNTLTLEAYRNINFNADITATGNTAGLVITPDTGGVGGSYYLNNGAVVTLSGFTPSLTIAGNAYTVINEANGGVTALQNMNMDLAGYYALGTNINASKTKNWNADAGFVPVGSYGAPFTGTFEGLGNTIGNIVINRPTEDNVGLFGYTNGSAISNVRLSGGSVTGEDFVGSLVGENQGGSIANVFSSVSVRGQGRVGGLVGSNKYGRIINSVTTGSVRGRDWVGGLVGVNQYGSSIDGSSSTSTVNGSWDVGGLVGANYNGDIDDSHAYGSVNGGKYSGGLVGYNSGSITGSSASGAVFGSNYVGGLVGGNSASITDSSASGAVFGSNYVGGLAGDNSGSIADSSASGAVMGEMNVGGLVGEDDGGSITGSSATGAVMGERSVGGLVGSNKYGGIIDNSNATGAVFGDDSVGGLVGRNYGSITNSNAGGLVFGEYDVGGLVGRNYGSISLSSATGAVSGNSYVGGLVGYNDVGSIEGSYATGAVSGDNDIGGLVGRNRGDYRWTYGTYQYGNINNSYATGTVSGNEDVGGLVGTNEGTIDNAFATGAVSGKYDVGGLVGDNYGNITNTFASGVVSGESIVGGLVGANYMSYDHVGIISFSHSIGAVTGNDNVGGLVGYNRGNITRAVSSGTVDGDWSVGGLVGYNDGTVDVNSHWDSDINVPGVGLNFGAFNATGLSTDGLMQPGNYVGWDFTNIWWMADGYTRPFLRLEYSTNITNAHQLQLMALDPTADYTLAADLDMTNPMWFNPSDMWGTTGFNPVGDLGTPFTGKFDGQNHTITNLFIYHPDQNYVGLFGVTGTGSDVSNIGLINKEAGDGVIIHPPEGVTGQSYVGALVGYNNGGAIENVYSTLAVTGIGSDGEQGGSTYVGGLVGYNAAAWDGSNWIGGSITNSSATGTVTGTGGDGWSWNNGSGGNVYAGGLVGFNDNGTITNSYANGLITGTGGHGYGYFGNGYGGHVYAGGLVGFNDNGTINNSYATGSVNGMGGTTNGYYYGSGGNAYVGGLIGYNNYGNISNVYATGAVSGSGGIASGKYGHWNGNTYAGGLIGFNADGNIENAYATGDVSGGENVGGLVGYNYSGNITNSYTTGNVTGTGTHIGGLVGDNYGGTIANTFATGDVSGDDYTGGLVGFNMYGSIENSYAIGDVSGDNAVGGLVGENQGGSIDKSYAIGDVTGTGFQIGGLVGYNWDDGSITNSYAAIGAVSGSTEVGGLVGYNDGSISDSYWDSGVNATGIGGGTLVGATGLSAAAIEAATTADNVWTGAGGDSLWTTTDNWNLGHVPTIFEAADIGAYSIDVPSIVMAKSVTTNGATLAFTGDTVSSLAIGQNGTVVLGTGAGDFNVDYGTSGKINLTGHGTGSNPLYLSVNGSPNYIVIQRLGAEGSNSGTDLQGINGDLDNNYVLGLDIDASSTVSWNGGTGFTPIGESGTRFTGVMDGLGHSVNNLYISRSNDYQGLFGYTYGTTLRNIGVLGADITAGRNVGALVGYNAYGNIDNAWSTGRVTGIGASGGKIGGNTYVGGLVGYNYQGSISKSFSAATVTGMGGPVADGNAYVGGLVGYNDGGTISESSASGTVTGIGGPASVSSPSPAVGGNAYVGGLVGYNYGGTISESSASGTVTGIGGSSSYKYGSISGPVPVYGGNAYVGGLVGYNDGGTINVSSASGTVTGTGGGMNGFGYILFGRAGDAMVGGLIGYNDGGVVSASSASGVVTGAGGNSFGISYVNFLKGGNAMVGGLVGFNTNGSIDNSHATGAVTGTGGYGRGKYGPGDTFSFGMGGNVYAGGLVGANGLYDIEIMGPVYFSGGSITGSSASGAVTAAGGNARGFKYGFDDDSIPPIWGGNAYVGGLVGFNAYGNIAASYAYGAVTGTGGNADVSSDAPGFMSAKGGDVYAGGLIGGSAYSSITASHAYGMVTGTGGIGSSYGEGKYYGIGGKVYAGGLVGSNGLYDNRFFMSGPVFFAGGTIGDSTASGPVTAIGGYGYGKYGMGGKVYAGGLVGFNYGSESNVAGISGSNASGTVVGIGGYGYGKYGEGRGGDVRVGGLVGVNIGSALDTVNITEAGASGTVVGIGGGSYGEDYGRGGDVYAGGLVGSNGLYDDFEHMSLSGGAISDSSATGSAVMGVGGSGYGEWNGTGGSVYVGGLVGNNTNFTGDAANDITRSNATATVLGVGGYGYGYDNRGAGGDVYAGGLVGLNVAGHIENAYANGNVVGKKGYGEDYEGGEDGRSYVGGLVGEIYNGSIIQSYATGVVYGGNYTGGLVGLSDGGSNIADAYATGMVTGEDNVGGLVGYNTYGSSIDNTYAIGMVRGWGNVGGLVGRNNGVVSDSFWDTETSGTLVGIGGGTDSGATGLTTAEMMTLSTFTDAGWSIDDAGGTGLTWRIYDGWSYPLLRDFLKPLNVTASADGNVSKTYDGNPYYLVNAVYDPAAAETDPNVFCVLTYGAAEGAVNAGTYVLTLGGLYSNQVGYDITFGSAELTVDPAVINLTGTRVYDGTTVFNPTAFGAGGTIATGIGTETLVLTGSGSVASKNVSAGEQALNIGTLTLGDGTGLASNYTFVGGVPTGTITPLAIIGDITAADKDYDGTNAATITGYSLSGVIGADIVSYTGGTATFSNANPGSNKTVTATGLYLTGADAGNYMVNDTAFTTASIIGPPPDYLQLLQYGLIIGGGSTLGGLYLGSFVQWPEPVPPIVNSPLQEGMLPPSFQLASYVIPPPVVEGVTVEIVRSWQSPKDKTKGSEGLIVVEISESLAQPGSFFTFTLPAIIADQIEEYDYKVKLTLADGSPLPAWLQYDNDSKTFTAVNVPEGYLPVTIVLDFGGQSWKIELKQQE